MSANKNKKSAEEKDANGSEEDHKQERLSSEPSNLHPRQTPVTPFSYPPPHRVSRRNDSVGKKRNQCSSRESVSTSSLSSVSTTLPSSSPSNYWNTPSSSSSSSYLWRRIVHSTTGSHSSILSESRMNLDDQRNFRTSDELVSSSSSRPRRISRRLFQRQLELLAYLSTLSAISFLFFFLPPLAFASLAAFVTFSAVWIYTFYSYIHHLYHSNQLTLYPYLPASLQRYFTTLSLHDVMTDASFYLEHRHLLIYFLPGLTLDQQEDLLRRLPARHRDAIFQPGGIPRFFLPEHVIRFLSPLPNLVATATRYRGPSYASSLMTDLQNNNHYQGDSFDSSISSSSIMSFPNQRSLRMPAIKEDEDEDNEERREDYIVMEEERDDVTMQQVLLELRDTIVSLLSPSSSPTVRGRTRTNGNRIDSIGVRMQEDTGNRNHTSLHHESDLFLEDTTENASYEVDPTESMVIPASRPSSASSMVHVINYHENDILCQNHSLQTSSEDDSDGHQSADTSVLPSQDLLVRLNSNTVSLAPMLHDRSYHEEEQQNARSGDLVSVSSREMNTEDLHSYSLDTEHNMEAQILAEAFSTMVETYSMTAARTLSHTTRNIVESVGSILIPGGLYLSSFSVLGILWRRQSHFLSNGGLLRNSRDYNGRYLTIGLYAAGILGSVSAGAMWVIRNRIRRDRSNLNAKMKSE